MQIELKVAQALINHKKTLSLAESCSGGLLTNRLTNISGSSNFLKFSCIPYSNESKIKILGVPASLIENSVSPIIPTFVP